MIETSRGASSAEAPVSEAPRRARRAGRLVLALVGAAGAYLLVSLVQVWQVGRSDQARPVDAIVVMGAAQYDGTPSPQLAARLDHAAELYLEGLAELVVVTGGKLPGDRFTEAQASQAYLVERGVPEAAILREDAGSTSYESLEGAAALLEARDLHRVLLVSDPFHSLRIRLSAQELGLTAYVSATRTSPVTGASAFTKHVKEAGGVALGRLIGFHRLPT